MEGMRDRKLKILNAIIKDYIFTAEPIGSRTIAKKYDLGISAATIRNEMSDLEDMGFLLQPHTSSGRIPSEKAYRLYVDQLMKIKKLDDIIEDSIRESYKEFVVQIENALKHTAKMLAQFTSYTSLVLSPDIKLLNCKLVQLIPIQDERLLMVIITKENIVKNCELKLSTTIKGQEIERLNNILNFIIKNVDFEMINNELINKLDELTIKENKLLQEILPVFKEVALSEDNNTVYSNGVTNILNYPEFNDVTKIKHFLEAIQEKNSIIEVLKNNNKGLNIIIGNENKIDEFKDCSLLTATYKINGEVLGTLGVVGPIRMDYERVVSVLELLTNELNYFIENNYKE